MDANANAQNARHDGDLASAKPNHRKIAGGPKHSSSVFNGKRIVAPDVSIQTPVVTNFDLPSDLVQFLRAGRALEYNATATEAGAIKLYELDGLTLSELKIQTYSYPDEIRVTDPMWKRPNVYGTYRVPAIDLVQKMWGSTDGSGFVLCWLPTEKAFGTFDTAHGVAMVFLDTSWTDITRNPAAYLNTMWQESGPNAEYFVPWPKYPFQRTE